MMYALKTLLVGLFLLGACADLPDDAGSSEDSLAASDEGPELLAARCKPNAASGACSWGKLPEGYEEIQHELASIRADKRAEFFAQTTSAIETTLDGRARLQWFSGSVGRGAIYQVRAGEPSTLGTFHIFGPILEAWVQHDYERGYGYFRDPVYNATAVSQWFGVAFEDVPSVANSGLLRWRVVLNDRGDGSVHETYKPEYLDSNNRDWPSSSPLQCRIIEYTNIGGLPVLAYPAVSFDGYTGATDCTTCGYELWCGQDPPSSPYDPRA